MKQEQKIPDCDQSSWRSKWKHLSACFTYPEDIRRIIYTTNPIEAVRRRFRKLTNLITLSRQTFGRLCTAR